MVENIINMLNGRVDNLAPMQLINHLSYTEKVLWQMKSGRCIIRHGYKNKCHACIQVPSWEELEYCYRNSVNKDGTVKPWNKVKPSCPQERNISCFRKCWDKVFDNVKACMPLINKAKNECAQKNVTGMKTIRMSMSMVEDILNKDPDIKVVYLIRDPRGIVSSRISARHESKLANKSWKKELELVCKKIRDDLVSLRNIKKKYPETLITLRYEDFSKDPVGVGKKLYEFINAPFPKEFQNWIMQNAKRKRDGGSFGTARINSSLVSSKWKEKVKQSQMKVSESICYTELKHFNYI